jgi:hypothetical protein
MPGSISFPTPVEFAPDQAFFLLPERIATILGAPIVPVDAARLADAAPARVEITWGRPAPGRTALPLRPAVCQQERLLAACRSNENRPLTWCMIDMINLTNAELVARVSESWGQGLAYLARAWLQDGDHGLSRAEASAIQHRCRMRVWCSPAEPLDAFRVLESLYHGCLPIQFTSQDHYDSLIAQLPPGLDAFVMPLPHQGAIPALDETGISRRLDLGLSVILAGNFERDWNLVLASTRSDTNVSCLAQPVVPSHEPASVCA